MSNKNKELWIEQIIKDYQYGLSCKQIGERYRLSDVAIWYNLKKSGVALRPSRSAGSKRSILSNQEILNMYKAGESIEEIAGKAGVKEQAVYKRLKRMGVKFPREYRYPKAINRKYNLNEDYFNNLSDEIFYIIGLIYTDGSMHKNKRSFSISQKEKSILVKIAKCFGLPEVCVKEIRIKGKYYHNLTVNSLKMCRSLCWYGIMPNKSKKVEFPKIPKQYMGSFLRGVIDGDGTVHEKGYRVVVYTASESFAEGLNQAFNELNLNSKIHVDNRGLIRITVSRKENVRRLADIIYENKGDLYLRSKYLRFKLV